MKGLRTILNSSILAAAMVTGACNNKDSHNPEWITSPIKCDFARVIDKQYQRGSDDLQSGMVKKTNTFGETYPDNYYVGLQPAGRDWLKINVDSCELFENVNVGDYVRINYQETSNTESGNNYFTILRTAPLEPGEKESYGF